MLSEREVHADLRDLLMDNRPFKYAHLVKFERPSRPDASGQLSTSAQRYTYLTDGSVDVVFDDQSVDLNGVANGPQTYIANKVLGVTAIQESSQAKADTASITLDGNGIGGAVNGIVTITQVNALTWDIAWPDSVSLINQGFREGDKIELFGARTGSFNIQNFRVNNTVRVGKIDDDLATGTVNISAVLSSEEVKSILLNKNLPEYASFINREVFIYRGYFENGQLVGAEPDEYGNIGPILVFRGIINNVSFDDDDSGIKVQWGLTSHWGDFSQVRGRITSDEFHRALDENGNPNPESAIKPIYAYDKGFSHSDTSLNLLANYTVMVDKTTVTAKNGFFGIGAKTKVKTVAVAEGRSTALDFQLQSKSIPLIYGVRVLSGSPVFADTLLTNSSEVYAVLTLSEGEIGGIYDVYIDGKSLICNNQEDFDARSTQNTEETVDLICRGRADRGDVLGGSRSIGTVTSNFYNTDELREMWNLGFNRNALQNYYNYLQPNANAGASATGRGVINGESIMLTAPQEITLDFFSGTESQRAASQLVTIAKAKNFKVQNDYWTGTDTAEYWGPNHRLLDTAYVVMKVKIKEGETTIPDIEFVVRGKVLDCYNYDYSYAHDDKMTAESPTHFNLGDTVTLSTGQSVQIIDKWTFARPNGYIETRFRYSQDPNLNYVNGVPEITRFSMTKGANTWTMTTFNWIMHSDTVPASLTTEVTVTETDGGVTTTFPSNPPLVTGGGTTGTNEVTVGTGQGRQRDVVQLFSIITDDGQVYKNALLSGERTPTSLTTDVL